MSEMKKEPNQTEKEFFNIVGTGRRGIEDMVVKFGDEIRIIAAPNVKDGWLTWSKRAIVEIANRDELAPVLATKMGMFSIYKCLAKAATMGLQIGGVFPQAYFMPKEGKAELVVTAEGYAFSAAHGPGAVLKSTPELVRVYEKDEFGVDTAKGAVHHGFDPRKDRGKHTGWYMRLEYTDGHMEIAYVTAEKIEQIVQNYSRQKTNANTLMPAFAKSPEEMRDKTAAKRLLRKPAREAEGLAMLLSLEGEAAEEPEAQAAQTIIIDRVGDRLDHAAEAMGSGEPTGPRKKGDPEPAKVPAPEQPQPQQPGKVPGDLF